jgi:hypothetical protein
LRNSPPVRSYTSRFRGKRRTRVALSAVRLLTMAGDERSQAARASSVGIDLPRPTQRYRWRVWRRFQRALDPLAVPRPLPIRPSPSGPEPAGDVDPAEGRLRRPGAARRRMSSVEAEPRLPRELPRFHGALSGDPACTRADERRLNRLPREFRPVRLPRTLCLPSGVLNRVKEEGPQPRGPSSFSNDLAALS